MTPWGPQELAAIGISVVLAIGCAGLVVRVARTGRAGRPTWLAALALAAGLGVSIGTALELIQTRRLAVPLPWDREPRRGSGVVVPDAEPGEGPALAANGSGTGIGVDGDTDTGGEAAPEQPSHAPLVAVEAAIPPPPTLAPRGERGADEFRREARTLISEAPRCRDMDEVARVWALRQPIGSDDPEFMRTHIAVTWLERCRQRAYEHSLFRLKVEHIENRRDFVRELKDRLRADGHVVKIELAGPTEEKMRIVGGEFDGDSSRALVDGGLGDELAALGFRRVTFVRYTSRYRYPVSGSSSEARLREQLEARGLHEPLTP